MPYSAVCLIAIVSFLEIMWSALPAVADSDVVQFKLEEVIEMALNRSPAMSAAKGGVRQIEGERMAAGAYPNPSFSAVFGPGKTRESLGDISFFERTLTLSQPIETPGIRQARQRGAEAALAGSQAAVGEARLSVLSDVKVAFYQLLLAQRDVELTMQARILVQDLFRGIKARVDAGQARPFEAIKANVELQTVSNELSRAQNSLVAVRARLDALTAGGLGSEFSVQGDFQASQNTFNRHEMISSALEHHPTVQRLDKMIEKAEQQAVQERKSVVPLVTVSGTYKQEAAESAYLAQLSIPIPLWYRRQGEIAAALGAKERTEAERVRAQNEIATSITEQVQEARTAVQQIDVFEKGLLKQAEEAVRIARISYQQGATGLLDLIDAQRVHRQTLFQYTQARAAFSVALARLERWTGALQ